MESLLKDKRQKQDRIRTRFLELNKEGKKAFIPYIMGGYPTLDATIKNLLILEECGADIIELGVPFSDPLADGPIIQSASDMALKNRINLKNILEIVKELRKISSIPLVLMTYYNPVFKYGEERFVESAKESGVDGVIIPDLPPDEATTLRKISHYYGFHNIFLVAPTSTERRIKLVCSASTGFIYYVSITGITGARLSLNGNHERVISLIRSFTKKPVCTGFGVSTPEEARMVASFSDGVIVGSAIVKRLTESEENLREYLKSIAFAIKEN